MTEPISPQTAEDDPRAALRREYLELLSRDFLDLPITLSYGSPDPHSRASLLPTLNAYNRLVGIHRDGVLPPQDAARAGEMMRSLLDRLREGAGPPGTPMSLEQVSRRAEQLREKAARGEYSGTQEIMEGLSRQVELDLAHLRLALPVPVFTGEYPTGDFNAWSVPSTSGVLILVNRGLFLFIYLMAKVYALCVHLNDPRPGDMAVRIDAGGLVVPADGPPKQAVVDLALDVLMSYLAFQQPSKARRIPPLGWPRGQVVEVLTTQTEKFVIAHEYGHVVAGHVTAAPAPARDEPEPGGGRADGSVAAAHAKEFAADGYGTAVMVTRDATAAGIGGGELGWKQAVAAGPAFFFALDEMILRFRAALGRAPAAGSDHPPSALRWQSLRSGFLCTSGPAALSLADGCVEWTRALGDDVIRRIKELQAGRPSAGGD